MDARELECWSVIVAALAQGQHLDHYQFQDALEGVGHFTEAEGDPNRDLIHIVVWPTHTPLDKVQAAALLSQYQALEGMVSPQMINRWWEFALAHGWIPQEIVQLRSDWR